MDDELIERDAERATLDEALGAAIGGAGRLLVIEAAPGLGKTRLLRALQEQASETPARVLKARGSELESKFAFGVVHQLLDAVVLGAPDSAFEGAARLAGPADLHRGAPRGPRTCSRSWTACGLVTGSRPSTARAARHDAQSADEPSRRFLAFLAKRIDGVPILPRWRPARSTTIPRCRSSRPTPRRAC